MAAAGSGSGGGQAAVKPDPLMQEVVRLRAANQAAAKENSRLRADAADREFECQQLDKTIRKLERKIEALEDAGTTKAAISTGFFKPAPADFKCPPPEPKAPEPPRSKPWEKDAFKERDGKGVIIDGATGEEVDPKAYWPEEHEEEEQNILLRKRGHRPEAELMQEMQHPLEINPEFDTEKYADLVGQGKKEDAEAMIRSQGGPTLEQMQRAPLEVLRKYPGLDPNWRDPAYNGCSLLHWACSVGFSEVSAELLRLRADPGLRSNGGMSALAAACSRNWPQCAQQLLAHRASPDEVVEPNGGQTLLMWASRIEYCDEDGNEHLNPFVAMLLQYRASHEAVDRKGKTALVHASTEGNATAVEALLAAKADVDVQDSEGNTPWQIALKYCHGRISSILLPRRRWKAEGTEGVEGIAAAAAAAA